MDVVLAFEEEIMQMQELQSQVKSWFEKPIRAQNTVLINEKNKTKFHILSFLLVYVI
jgi:hypothetical protein